MSKMLITLSLVFGTLVMSPASKAEEAKSEPGIHDKGSFFAYWGWNRGYYSTSDLTLEGDNYKFELNDISASDRPSTIGIDPYLNPLDMTRPQTNFRVGYFFADNYSVSFGVDHMKYIMDQEQTAEITGQINVGSEFDGTYNNEPFYLGHKDEEGDVTFLAFEHSDGLNYLNAEVTRFDQLHHFSENLIVSSLLGGGIGVMLPKTNATLLNNERHDDFHVSGWGTHIKGGLELSYKSFFFRSEVKLGYIDMPDIRTTQFEADSASQHFRFTEWTFVLGSYF